MPFKSAAQRRAFQVLLGQGKITPAVFREWSLKTAAAGAYWANRVKW